MRTPAVDVPVSTLSGAAPAGSSVICSLFGSTTPFTPQQLSSLYQTKTHYLALYRASLHKAIAKGFILSADRARCWRRRSRCSSGYRGGSAPTSVIGC